MDSHDILTGKNPLAGYFSRYKDESEKIRDVIQHFIDDKNLVRNRPSLTTERVLGYDKDPQRDPLLSLDVILAYLKQWSDLLFENGYTETRIWEDEDSEYKFGLSNEKRILKYGDLAELFSKALEVSQIVVTIAFSQEKEKEKEEKPEVVKPEEEVTKEEEKKAGIVLPVKRKKEEEKDEEKLKKQFETVKDVSASMRREHLRIQESVLYAISSETGIPIDTVRTLLSEDVSRLTSASLFGLSSEDLQGTLLNVSKKMELYRDILRNPEVIAKTQLLLKQNATEKSKQTSPQAVLQAIQKEEESVVADPKYVEQVEQLKISFSLSTDQYETSLQNALKTGGIPESDVVRALSRAQAYALARKNVSSSNWLDIKDLLLPILGQELYGKAVSYFGNEEALSESFEILITKTQMDWKERTQKIALLHTSTHIPIQLTDEVAQLIHEYGDISVGYAFYLSRSEINERHKHFSDLLKNEKNTVFEKELLALENALKLQGILTENLKGIDNKQAREVYNKYLNIELILSQKIIDGQTEVFTDDTVFFIPKNDISSVQLIEWEEIESVPYINQPELPIQIPQTTREDALNYRLAASSQARQLNLPPKYKQMKNALGLAKKAKGIIDALNRFKIIISVLSAIFSAILPLLPLILAAVSVIALGAKVVNFLRGVFAANNAEIASTAKGAFSKFSVGTAKAAKAYGGGAKSALFSPAAEGALAQPTTASTSLLAKFGSLSIPAASVGTTAGIAIGGTMMVVVLQTSSFLMEAPEELLIEEEHILVTKTAESPQVPWLEGSDKRLPNTAAQNGAPIKYTITVQPEKDQTLQEVKFTDTTKVVARGPNYDDTINPPNLETVRYTDGFNISDATPPLQNNVEYPEGTSDITINANETFTITYTLNLKPEYRDSLVSNTIQVKGKTKDGVEQQVSRVLTIKVGNPPKLSAGCFTLVEDEEELDEIGKKLGVVTSAFTANHTSMIETTVESLSSSSTFMNYLCEDGEIFLVRAEGNYGGWVPQINMIVLYNRGLSSQSVVDYTLSHEAAHIVDFRNALRPSFEQNRDDAECFPTYPVKSRCQNPQTKSKESFAEAVSVYFVHTYYKFPGIGLFDFPNLRPKEYTWVKDNIYGGEL